MVLRNFEWDVKCDFIELNLLVDDFVYKEKLEVKYTQVARFLLEVVKQLTFGIWAKEVILSDS